MAGRATRGGRKTITPDTGISGDFKNVEYKEAGGGYDGPDPSTGLYPLKLSTVGAHTTSDTSIVWTFDITDGKYAGWRGWVYSDMDNAQWKTQQILVALGVIEPNGEINKTYEQIMAAAEPCRGRLVTESYEGEARAKIRSFLKGVGTATVADEDDEEEAEPDEDFDDKKPARGSGKPRNRGKADPAPDPGEDEGDDEREAREADLLELSPTSLKKAAKDAGLTLADYRGKDPEDIVEMILDKEFPEVDDEEKEEGIDLDALEEELEDMSLADLKKKAKEFNATRAELKEAVDEEALIDLILEKAEEQNPSF